MIRPTPAVAAVVLSNDLNHVVLVKRGKPPALGQWTIPGGVVESGETLRAACAREVLEEIGLEVAPQDLVKLVERIISDEKGTLAFHYVIADFWAVVEGTPPVRALTDVVAARWVPIGDLGTLDTTRGLAEVIHAAVRLAQGHAPTPPLCVD